MYNMYSGNNLNRGRAIQFSFFTAHIVSFDFVHFQNQSELLIGERRSHMIWWYTFTRIKRSICRLWNEVSLSESAIETINIWSLFVVFACKERMRSSCFFLISTFSVLQCLLLFTFISLAKFIFVTHSFTHSLTLSVSLFAFFIIYAVLLYVCKCFGGFHFLLTYGFRHTYEWARATAAAAATAIARAVCGIKRK